jgi:hypothetical protein
MSARISQGAPSNSYVITGDTVAVRGEQYCLWYY